MSNIVGGTIAWHENADGKGSFGLRRTIVSQPRKTELVGVVDMDEDGDMDAKTQVLDL